MAKYNPNTGSFFGPDLPRRQELNFQFNKPLIFPVEVINYRKNPENISNGKFLEFVGRHWNGKGKRE